jgi:hypothetical protein
MLDGDAVEMAGPELARRALRSVAGRRGTRRMWKVQARPREWAAVVDLDGPAVWAATKEAVLEPGAQDVRGAQEGLHGLRQSWDATVRGEAVAAGPLVGR